MYSSANLANLTALSSPCCAAGTFRGAPRPSASTPCALTKKRLTKATNAATSSTVETRPNEMRETPSGRYGANGANSSATW